MGFSGGGSNITKSHTHSSAIVQDGGSLDFDNVTQAGLSAGDLTFSDGSALQVLNVGSASDVLTVNGAATAPEWVAPASGGATLTRQYVTTTTEFTTSSTSYIDVTSMTVTLQAGTGNCFLTFNSLFQQSGSSGFCRWECSTDGTQQEGKITSTSSKKEIICLPYVTNTLGAQTCKIQSKNDNGNTNYFAVDAEGPSTICALEIS